VLVGLGAPTEAVRDQGRFGLRVPLLRGIGGLVTDARPAFEREVHLADDGTEFPERAIDPDARARAGVDSVADRCEEAEIVAIQQAPSGR
jgi:hypothetical protein